MQVHVRLAHNVLQQAVLGSNGRHPWVDAGQAPWPVLTGTFMMLSMMSCRWWHGQGC